MERLSVKNLKVAGKFYQIQGVSQMNKTQLIEAIQAVAVQPQIEEMIEMTEVVTVVEEVVAAEVQSEVVCEVVSNPEIQAETEVVNTDRVVPENPEKQPKQKVKWPAMKEIHMSYTDSKFHMWVSEEGGELKFVKTYAKAATAEFHFDRVLNDETNGIEKFFFHLEEMTIEEAIAVASNPEDTGITAE